MATRANYSGLVIAGIGFFLTRFTVTLALNEDPLRFYLGGIVPLVLGLGLAAFGVALVVADVDAALVRTTAAWCVIGAATMLVLVVLTLVATDPRQILDIHTARSQTYLSNFLIGGSVGGTLTGLYAATNRRQRVELSRQANRLEVLNRLLRHEVLNAVTVIKGHASLATAPNPDVWGVIEERSAAIERTIDEVKYLARDARSSSEHTRAVTVGDRLAASIEAMRSANPDADIAVDAPPEGLAVRANDQLDRVFVHLIEAAVGRSSADGPAVSVSVEPVGDTVHIDIRYVGPAMSDQQRGLLERGAIGRYDDPQMGFGLHIARLLVENYGGTIETDRECGAETISVVLSRADADGSTYDPNRLALAGVLPALPDLVVSLGAALVAGVVYGIIAESLGGSIAGIGVFYGPASPVVGWITHEFHSVVFGFVYLGLLSQAPDRFREDVWGYVTIGVGWAVVLWLVAAGVIAPIWLQLLGRAASIPNLSPELLASHLGWGVALAVVSAWGHAYLSPKWP